MRLHIKYIAHLVFVVALLLLTACGNDSSQMVISTKDGITTYNGIDRQIRHVADGEQRELHISVSRQDGSISISVLQTEGQKYAYRGNDIPTSDFIKTQKSKDRIRLYSILFFIGILVGIFCRLTDFFSYESLWSLPSIATLFGFWIASVSLITYCSSSNLGAFGGSFLYMFGMTVSFYTLKFLLGFFWERFSGEFPTTLFLAYFVMALICGIGSYILYFWNKENVFSSLLCALPASAMLAEAIACSIVLWKQKMFLGQTLFDFIFAVILGALLYWKARNRILFFFTLVITTGLVFFLVYRPYLL